jgi:fermentation-respiration switch protein FrsA (DUF1100 family)
LEQAEWPLADEIAERFLYYPDRIPSDTPPPPWASGATEVWLEAVDGVRIHGLRWPGPEDRPALLYLHGNAQEVYSWSLVHRELSPLECSELLIDYRGYGKSGGRPGEEGLYLDGRAALDRLAGEGFADEDIIVFGKSLGGGVACDICRRRDMKALILESAFTSLYSVANNLFPFVKGYKPEVGAYNSLEKLGEIHCPVMVIHGDADTLIPVEEGLSLFDAAMEPKELFVVAGAGHNDVSMIAGPEYGRRIRAWLDSLGSSPKS